MKETRKQKVDRQRGHQADRAIDPIRKAMDDGDLVITSPSSAAKGVAFTEPPTPILADATRLVGDLATQLLPREAKGGVIGVATDAGWNAAVVHRAGERFQVASWVGKNWGSGLTGGAAVRATW